METIKLAAAAILIKAGADLATLTNLSGAQQQMNQDRDWWNQYRRLASSRFWTGPRMSDEERLRRGGIWSDPQFQRHINQLAIEAAQNELNPVYAEMGRGAPVLRGPGGEVAPDQALMRDENGNLVSMHNPRNNWAAIGNFMARFGRTVSALANPLAVGLAQQLSGHGYDPFYGTLFRRAPRADTPPNLSRDIYNMNLPEYKYQFTSTAPMNNMLNYLRNTANDFNSRT